MLLGGVLSPSARQIWCSLSGTSKNWGNYREDQMPGAAGQSEHMLSRVHMTPRAAEIEQVYDQPEILSMGRLTGSQGPCSQ